MMTPKKQNSDVSVDRALYVNVNNEQVIVFPWKCPIKSVDKVTVIVTLPSGVYESSVEVILNGDNDKDSYSEKLVIKYPWNDRMLVPKTLFKTGENKRDKYELYPESQALLTALKSVREKVDEVPYTTVEIKLPMPVQTNDLTWESKFRKVSNFSDTRMTRLPQDRYKQLVVIVRMTGIVDKYLQTAKRSTIAYESSDEEYDDEDRSHSSDLTQSTYATSQLRRARKNPRNY